MQVYQASHYSEFQSIFALRHQVNISELKKTFLEEYYHKGQNDSHTYHLYVRDPKQNVIGSLRCEFTSYSDRLCEKWGIKPPLYQAQIAVVDQLVISKDHRRSRAAYSLAKSIYSRGLCQGIHLCLIEAEGFLLCFYKKMGFKQYRTVEYDYGTRFQMYLNTWDIEHLRSCNSPFIQDYEEFKQLTNSFMYQSKEVTLFQYNSDKIIEHAV
jgi:hypothetical protein